MVKKAKKDDKRSKTRFAWPFGPRNYMVFGAGMVSIIAGYIALGMGSISLAPVLLILGYCVLIPVAIMVKDKSKVEEASSVEDA